MRFDETLRVLFEDYKEFNAKAEVLREEGLSDVEVLDKIEHVHPEYPTDPTEAVWFEAAKMVIAAFVSTDTADLLESYLEV